MNSDYIETVLIPSPIQSKATVNKQIVVAGGGRKSYEVFDWSTQQWTLHEDTLFFDHTDGFPFVYDNKIMICGGTRTNKVECLDISDHRSVSTFPAQLVDTECGKGVLCGDGILTFGESVSRTSLKPPFKTTVISYSDRAKLSRWSCMCQRKQSGRPRRLPQHSVQGHGIERRCPTIQPNNEGHEEAITPSTC
jgi:hypothetical protein